jgi:hypothetical protein
MRFFETSVSCQSHPTRRVLGEGAVRVSSLSCLMVTCGVDWGAGKHAEVLTLVLRVVLPRLAVVQRPGTPY